MKIKLFFATILQVSFCKAVTTISEVKNIIEISPEFYSATYTNETEDALHERAIYLDQQLPTYKVSISNFLKFWIDKLAKDASRTLNKKNDFYPRIEKLIHSNGICFTGNWHINNKNKYSGLFIKGSNALIVARISAATLNTVAPDRSIGFAGKLFPTTDVNQSVDTADFFTLDSIFGTPLKQTLKTSFTNQPDTGIPSLTQLIDGTIGLAAFIKTSLNTVDTITGFRPLYPIALSNNSEIESTPHWLKIVPSDINVINYELDFRNELNIKKHHPNGLKFDIFVSDTTRKSNTNKGWNKIGEINLTESFISYGCDRQLHFHHPQLRPQDNFSTNIEGGYSF